MGLAAVCLGWRLRIGYALFFLFEEIEEKRAMARPRAIQGKAAFRKSDIMNLAPFCWG